MNYPITLNLQLFAGEQSVTIDGQTFEIEDDSVSVGGQPIETEDGGIEIPDEPEEEVETSEVEDDGLQEEGNNAGEDDRQQAEVTQEPKADKNPAAAAAMAERRKWQERVKQLEREAEIARKVMQAAGVTDPEEFQRQLDAIEANKYVEQGLDHQTAQMLVAQQRQLEQMQRELQRQRFDVEAEVLKKDPFFADIEDYREDLEPLVQKGLTLQQAYMALRGPARMEEMKREIEQRMIADRTKKQSAKVDTSVTGGAAKKGTRVQLTPDELAIAKLAGMTPEEYFKFKKQ